MNTLMEYSRATPRMPNQHRTSSDRKELKNTSEVERIQQEQMDRAYQFARLAADGVSRRLDVCELAD